MEVVYECTEDDWLSPDDEEQRRGSGLLVADAAGRTVVLTVRSLCDGTAFMADTLGGPEIRSEAIRVVVPGIGVYRAGRTWVDPQGGELALLVVEDAPPDHATTQASTIDVDADPTGPVDFATDTTEHTNVLGTTLPALPAARGGVLVRDGRALGLIGGSVDDENVPARIPLSSLPAELRPAK